MLVVHRRSVGYSYSYQMLSTVVLVLLLFSAVIATASNKNEKVAEQTCLADGTCQQQEQQQEQQQPLNTGSCVDDHDACGYWADIGECSINPGYMHVVCKKSCELCSEMDASTQKMEGSDLELGLDFGVAQELYNTQFQIVDTTAVTARLLESRHYLDTVQLKKGLKELCRNEHEHCTTWALAGECNANPNYMKLHCAPACMSCDYLSVEGRCPIDPDAINAWGPGDLDAMFAKLSAEPYLSKYEVQVLSSPQTTGGPWVITMENVVSEQEAERLIELGTIEGYERSSDVGAMKADGTFETNVNEGRTSSNAWCQKECYEDAMGLAVAERLSNLTGINETNSEYLQLLKYEKGQKYQVHHDYIEHHISRQPGVRILTMYLYLNDVEAGGGTNFDKLDVTVQPKRGRALLWPSVLDSDPDEKDDRTTHQALPVEAGLKYGANAWFHQRDFKTPNHNGCH